jgi:hypothetical protein
MSENIARNMQSSQEIINYSTQLHLVGHFRILHTIIYKAITNYVVLPLSDMKIARSHSMSLTKLGLHCHKQKPLSVLTVYRILLPSQGILKLP